MPVPTCYLCYLQFKISGPGVASFASTHPLPPETFDSPPAAIKAGLKQHLAQEAAETGNRSRKENREARTIGQSA